MKRLIVKPPKQKRFFDSKGNQLSKKASRKLKEEIKLVPANHLLVTGKNKSATRSGRVDSIDRVKQVVEDGPRAIYRDLTDKALLNVPPTNGEDMLLKNDTLKGSGFRWVKGPNDIYELTHRTHLATGMDSRRDESQFFNPMKSSIEQYSATEISLYDGVKCTVLNPIFSPSPQSPFGQTSMSLIGTAGKLLGQFFDTIKNHKDTLISKCEILQGANNGFKTKFSNQFTDALKKIIPECHTPTNFTLTDFSGMSNQETLFLKYALYVLGNKSTDIDSKLIFEVGIDSFDDLSGVLPHKSCKSGQDRTLTQIAFQETLASYNFKLPETENEKKEFAATFFVNAAMQATL